MDKLIQAREALEAVRDAFRVLSESAGDVPEWNEGGIAYEASKRVRAALLALSV